MQRLTTSLPAVFLAVHLAATAFAADQDVAQLIDGVKAIGASGAPGPLCLYGEDAFPVVLGKSGDALLPVAAAARLGEGRVVAFGHTGYLGDAPMLASGDMPCMMANAVHWTAGDKKSPTVGVHRHSHLIETLQREGIDAVEAKDLKAMSCDVLFVSPTDLRTEADRRAVVDFVKQGGGLVTANLGWGWLQLNPGKDITQHPGNLLLAEAGIAWADGMLSTTVDQGYAVDAAPTPLVVAPAALDLLEQYESGKTDASPEELRQAARTVELAAQTIADNDPLFYPRLQSLESKQAEQSIPTAKRPLTTKQPLARLVLSMQVRRMRQATAEDLNAHPAAVDFPGEVPADAARVKKTLEFDTSTPEWRSTGLYAAPGETITVETTDDVAGLRRPLKLRIGCHNDRLWHKDDWRRVPEITQERPIDAAVSRHANPFGGLVYVVVPRDCPLDAVRVTISGAVEAPLYVLGETSLDDWRETIRSRPAPWAELATDKVILSIPSRHVRSLDDPQTLMMYWDRVLDACADLAQRPRERMRPERFVADRQISAGYMHSGYPIMTPDTDRVCRAFADLDVLKNGDWGLFHEMGHNHQSGDWTFSGSGEVTVNLFTLYVYENVCGISIPDSRDVLSPEGRMKKLKPFLAAGAPFEQWKSDPFLALIMYVQLREAFGWEAFEKTFAEYRDLPRSERPKNDDEERDQWMVRFSRTVGRDLGPFFQTWGVPTSEAARQSIAGLPDWTPPEFEQNVGR